MKFASTRNKNHIVSFKEAVFQGLSPEGGLYNPIVTPDLSLLFQGMDKNTSFTEAASRLAAEILKEDLSEERARDVCKRAFPFKPVLTDTGNDIQIMELYHGPSCAFKDFGASFLATSMEEFLKGEKRKAIILTATSGDTGSAVAQAFYKKENIEVVILYPSGRVSPLQEKQLTTLGENITALEVKGSFDDCQRMVKEAFVSEDLKHLPLTSANSINLGRLFPQSFYYVDAVNKLKDDYENIVFCVPSGNFGNLTAGVLANRWGLPVKEFIAATNLNKVVPEYLESGIYNARPSELTYSNAMDVGNPSNFERLKDIFEGDCKKMGDRIKGDWVDDETTLKVIKDYFNETDSFLDPHTAVAYEVSKRYKAANPDKNTAVVALSTAHPGKFLEVVEDATGVRPQLPSQLKKILKLEKDSVVIENTTEDLKTFLMKTY